MEKKKRMGSEGENRPYKSNEIKKLGTTDMGISKFSKEPYNCELTPLKNKFSKMFDVSMDEAMRMAGGNASMRDREED